MRSKEDAADYRYFSEPDLLVAEITEQELVEWQKELPENPYKKAERFKESLGLRLHEADQLTQERSIADYFEKLLSLDVSTKLASSWILGETFSVYGQDFEKINVSPERTAELLELIQDNVLSRAAARKVFTELPRNSRTAQEIAQSMNLLQVSDISLIEEKVDNLLNQHRNLVEEYRGGKQKVFGFFVG